ncbi:MAG: rRNA maturation RNase YbeY [Patescibacteria group bacterium]
MPTNLQCDDCPLEAAQVELLWEKTRQLRQFSDDQVNIKCVSEEEIRTQNRQYRGKDKATNVLTFSYPSTSSGQVSEHDVSLCLTVAQREAAEQGVQLRDYVALLLAHAFLHATGLDHERSRKEALATAEAEAQVLAHAGFLHISL